MNGIAKQCFCIFGKLSQAIGADPRLKVFGAEAHRYVVLAPATPQTVSDLEALLLITLAPSHRRRVLEAGNGGDGHSGFAAGPFNGIYRICDRIAEMPVESLAKVVARTCTCPRACHSPIRKFLSRMWSRMGLWTVTSLRGAGHRCSAACFPWGRRVAQGTRAGDERRTLDASSTAINTLASSRSSRFTDFLTC